MLLTKLRVKDNVKLDFLHIEEVSSTNPNIFSDKKFKPTLNNYSRFLASFDNGDSIANGIADVALGYSFSVYKEEKDTNRLRYVAHLDDGSLSMVDYNVANNQTYKYYIFKEDESAISEAVISNDIDTCWWDWSIIDLIPNENEKDGYYADKNSIWKLNLNLSSSVKNQVIDVTVYDNLTKFPKVSTGKNNYSKGSLSCLLGNIQKTSDSLGKYIEPASMLDEWNNFCANGRIKLLKDRKGNAMLVNITETSSQIADEIPEQPTTITFGWVQVEDITNVTIIGV